MIRGRLFYCAAAADVEPGAVVTLDTEESRHLLNVLRASPGDTVALTDGRGNRYTGVLHATEATIARVRIDARRADPGETAPPRLRLVCAVVKENRFAWAMEKAVEAGAHALVPLVAARGVICPGAGRRRRWSSLIQTAMKQAHRSLLPDLASPVSLVEALALAAPDPVFYGALAADLPDADVLEWNELPLRRTLWWGVQEGRDESRVPDWLTVVIGPEGGWTADERSLLRESAAVPLRLGPHVLRSETAALAGVMALQVARRVWSTGAGDPA